MGILAVLWVALSVAAELGVRALRQRYPPAATAEGDMSDDAIFLLLRIAIVVFILIVLVLVYAAVRFRARPGDTGDSAVQVQGSRIYTLTWLGFSVALNVLFAVNPGITGLYQIWSSANAQAPLVVVVTGLQWTWSFDYPQYGLRNQSTLVLPVKRTTKFLVRSQDVIHSFWVPAFRLKVDAIPGQTRVLYLTPTRITSTRADPLARVQCAELCGVGHAWMRAPVRVISPADFGRWTNMARNQSGAGM